MQSIPRRSMSQALRMSDLPPEALAIIKEGAPSSRTEPAIAKSALDKPPADGADNSPQPELTRPEQSDRSSTGKQKVFREKEATGDNAVRSGLVSLSVRVPPEIPDAL